MTSHYRIRNVVIAVALAAAAVLLTFIYITSARQDEASGKELVSVFVAEQDFPVGTSGAKIADNVEITKMEKRIAAPEAVTKASQVAGLYTAQPIYAGEQVTLKRFVAPKAQGIRAEMKGRVRALEVPGTASQLLAGTLTAGDRVDVVAVVKEDGISSDARSATVLRNLRVLETGQSEDASIRDGGGNRVILAVTDDEAQKLFLVTKTADWTLQLRPVRKPQDGPRRIDTTQTVLAGDAK